MIAPAIAPPTRREPTTREVIGELLETVSASRINCWTQCRLKFWFRYVQRLAKPPTPALYVGSIVHGVLQVWNVARWRRQNLDLAKLKESFNGQWIEGQQQQEQDIKWNDEEPEQKTGAWNLLETYFKDTPIPMDEKPEGVEVSVEADLALHGLPRLVGVIDLVRAGGRIVDFKTSGQTPSAEKAGHMNETQTSCYSVMYREATGRKESGVELHTLVKLKTPKLVVMPFEPMSNKQQSRLFKVIESHTTGLEREDFVPCPGLHCHSCEFFNECRKWS